MDSRKLTPNQRRAEQLKRDRKRIGQRWAYSGEGKTRSLICIKIMISFLENPNSL